MNKFNSSKYTFSSIPSMILIGDRAEENRNKQINLFLKEISLYKILIKDLIDYPPTEKQKNIILNISYYIVQNNELVEIIERKKDLPISKFSKQLKIKDNFLKKWRDYILMYYIIFLNPEYKCIQDYFRIEETEKAVKSINVRKKSNLYRGIAIQSFKRSSCILTSSGEFIKIKTNREIRIGEEASGQEKAGLRHYKLHISIMAFILIILGAGLYNYYGKVKSTVILNTTSTIKLELNFLNKVIYAYSPTDKGKKIIVETDLLNKNIDIAIKEILEDASENDMIPQKDKMLITISGKTLEYGTLKETSKFANEKNIPILINNGGNQHKLSKNLYE
ncbi:anti-sigma factor domain-containing protein [Clostridium weizhouense]|uniref:Anti-sigma factor domain-containing protein n=1 Tax=Clostridium weizhouense TaxID=2859781 RepID=A0ABS7APX6_9CLOT|nr:anti-sigma factor domain-containing protein [Clostridium weizhouense]MBW6410471.1 anti-sigma factor domain-containing protein [Clostridium weizhouense]